MLIALLAVLGVDLIVLIAFAALLLSRKRWVGRQPGAFRGAIRVADGDVDGLGPKWKRGSARWVRDVLVWTKAPFQFRNVLLASDDLVKLRPAAPGEIERLGDEPIVVTVTIDGATVQVAARQGDRALLMGPYHERKEQPS